MNKQFIAGFVKRAQQHGLPAEAALAILKEAAPASGLTSERIIAAREADKLRRTQMLDIGPKFTETSAVGNIPKRDIDNIAGLYANPEVGIQSAMGSATVAQDSTKAMGDAVDFNSAFHRAHGWPGTGASTKITHDAQGLMDKIKSYKRTLTDPKLNNPAGFLKANPEKLPNLDLDLSSLYRAISQKTTPTGNNILS